MSATSTGRAAGRSAPYPRPAHRPGQQFLLLALQLFEQFGAHFAALQHVQQVGDGAKEGEGDGGFTQGALAVQLLQQKFDA